jgi:hypothetical protein
MYQQFVTWILEIANSQRELNGLPPLTPTEAKLLWKQFHTQVTTKQVPKLETN